MPSKFDKEALEKAAAWERYDQAHGYGPFPINAKVTLITKRAADLAAPEKQTKQTKSRYQKETAIQWTQRAMQLYNLQPLTEAKSANSYDVTNPSRYQKPPALLPLKQLVKNVASKRSADDIEMQGIEPKDFKKWREEYLGATPEQLAVVLRVTPRTIRNWERDNGRIPFMMVWAMQQIKPADIPIDYQPSKPTRYYKPEILDAGNLKLRNILMRYAHVMKPHGITSNDFRQWRTNFMLMSPEQIGQLLRVPSQTIDSWESGKEPIPFSVWWVMHTMLQDPEIFLDGPGFHDFYIEYVNGESVLCSRRYPDIRCTPKDLYFNRAALSKVVTLEQTIRLLEEKRAGLEAENIRLRQMLKAGTIATELKTMHDHLGQLMRSIHTADIVAFPEPETAEIINLKQAAA